MPVNVSGKATPIKIGLAVLSIAYLGLEAAFNANLVDTAASFTIDGSGFTALERFGRSTASIGLTLLLVSVFARDRWQITGVFRHLLPAFCALACLPFIWVPSPSTIYVAGPATAGLLAVLIPTIPPGKRRAAAVITMIALAAAPSMYFGQKAFFERVVVAQSTPEQRQAARYVNLLKAGLSEGVIELDGAPIQPDQMADPAQKTFLVLLGGAAYLEPDIADVVRNNRKSIVNAIEDRLADRKVDEMFADYKAARKRFIREAWAPYQEARETLRGALAEATSKAERRWRDLQQTIDDKWSDYQTHEARFEDRISKQAPKAASRIRAAVDDLSDCQTERCIRGVQEAFRDGRLNDALERKIGERTELLADWCRKRDPDATEVIGEIERALNNPIGTLLQGGTGTEFLRCATTPTLAKRRLREIGRDHFQDRSGGYPPGLSRAAFRQTPTLARDIRATLAEKDINLPETWRPTDRATFVQTVKKEYRSRAWNAYASQLRQKLGERIPADLAFADFVQQPVVQARARNATAKDWLAANEIDFTVRQKSTFLDQVVRPRIQDRIDRELAILESATSRFANDGDMATEGRAAVRAAFIPPLAMFISLTLGLVTAVKTAAAFVSLPFTGAARLRTSAIAAVWVLGGAMMVATPFLTTNAFVRSETFAYLIARFQERDPIAARAAGYAMSVQPIVYPVGDTVERLTHIGIAFQASAWPIEPAQRVLPSDFDARIERLASTTNRAAVRRHQAALKGRGFYDGAIDGLFGPKTRSATRHAARDGAITRLMADHGIEPVSPYHRTAQPAHSGPDDG